MGLVSPDLPNPQCFAQLLEGTWGGSPDVAEAQPEPYAVASTGEST